MTWPKLYHRIWLDEDERPEFAEWRDRLGSLHPGWEIRTWNDSSKLGWMRYADLMQELLQTDPFGRAPDLLRYELLWKFGGVYIDTDFEPLRPMDELLEDPRPFAGWENDRTMCTALLAAPPEHPAIGILLDGIEDRLAATEGKPANEAIGPEYATALWRERDDVRRLPPWAFYPVGWWERSKLGRVTYLERSYAVHHWAKGWDAKPSKPVRVAAASTHPSFSVLIAWRDTDGSRTDVWELLQAKFAAELPEAEVIVGTDDGEDPFHKTLALNRAASEATTDVFLLGDADTWVDPERIRQAVAEVRDNPGQWVRPWNVKLKMNTSATHHVIGLGETWDGTIDHRPFGRPEDQKRYRHAPPFVLHRDAWDAVGGMDERFRGWGQEDLAICLALERLVGAQRSYAGFALHLWHPRLGRSGNDRWAGQDDQSANIALAHEYRRARTPEAMRELIANRMVAA